MLFIEYNPIFLYLDFWLVMIGTFVLIKKQTLIAWMSHIPGSTLKRYLIIAALVVATEEVLAALVNNMGEGFSFGLWGIRIQQFILFNLFAFTGFYLAWYYLYTRYNFTINQAIFTAGLWGLFSERLYTYLFSNPLAFSLMAIPMVFVYALMLYIALISLPPKTNRKPVRYYLYPLSYGLIILCSIIPMLTLSWLRENYGYLFPPASMIPL